MPTLPGVPEQIARYQLLSELGRGAMGHVYLALDPNIERKVALKIFLPLLKVGVGEQWELRQRFILEARAAGRLSHPGIVTIFDADTDPDTGLSYIAMEWINGPSLDDLIRESGPLSVERAVSIVEQVATALDAAHRQGLIHRDIKPANIMLESDGQAKVTDFGIAKLASMSITSTGWIPGSPFYMSPEQMRNDGIDQRTDLYSLGAVLYQCLTGTLPFDGDSLAALTHMIVEIDPRPPQSLNPAVTDDLAAVIRKAMAKSPAERFASGVEFAQALRQARAGTYDAAAGGGVPTTRPRMPTSEQGRRDGSGTVVLGTRPPVPGAPEVSETTSAPAPAPVARTEAEPRPAVGQGTAPERTRRWIPVALAAGAALAALWSLRPVASEPSMGSQPAAIQTVHLAPRFGADGSAPGSPLELPTDLRPPEIQPEPVAEPAPPTRELPSAAPPAARPRPSAPARSEPLPVAEPTPLPVVEPAPLPVVEPAPRVQPTSTLEVVYRNRLKSALLSVSIDGEKAWTRSVANPDGLLKRAIGRDVWTTLKIPPGEHVVDVRITGSEGKLDLVRQTTATFVEGETRRLRVVLVLPKMLKLSWKELHSD